MPALPKPPTTKQLIVRELLWLLGILVAAAPLSVLLHGLTEQLPPIQEALRAELGAHVSAGLYVLVVLACYLGRLGAAGATHLATATPEA